MKGLKKNGSLWYTMAWFDIKFIINQFLYRSKQFYCDTTKETLKSHYLNVKLLSLYLIGIMFTP